MPCDSLCVRTSEKIEAEAAEAEAWIDGKPLFSGPVDSQTAVYQETGRESTLWARSTAAFLVDNECVPCSYHMPTADTLYYHFAREFGFVNGLPPMLLEHTYDVQKGTSRWGALETFVKSVTGQQLIVDCEKRIRLLTPTDRTLLITDREGDKNGLRFSRAQIKRKRSAPVTEVIYKKEAADPYNRRAANTEAAGKKLFRSRCLNLASLPAWRREKAAAQLIENSLKDYFKIEVTLPGLINAELYDRAVFESESAGVYNHLLVSAICLRSDSRGERTVLSLMPEYGACSEFYIM